MSEPHPAPAQHVVVHTDGACSGNPGPGGWAVLLDDGELISGNQPFATNNEMELYAVLQALMHMPDGIHLHVVTDSRMVIGWLHKRWVKNRVYIRVLAQAYFAIKHAKGVTVTFERIKGHSGHPGNEYVDREAVRQSKIARAAYW